MEVQLEARALGAALKKSRYWAIGPLVIELAAQKQLMHRHRCNRLLSATSQWTCGI